MALLLALMTAALVGLALGTTSNARASNCNGVSWKGGTGSWSDNNMWSGGVVPTRFDNVCIDAKMPSVVTATVTNVAAGSQFSQPTAKSLVVGGGGPPQKLVVTPGTYEGVTPSRHAITSFTTDGPVTIGTGGKIVASSYSDAYVELAANGGWLNYGSFETTGGNVANPVTVGSGAADFVNHKDMKLGAATTNIGGFDLTTTGSMNVSGALVLQGTTNFHVSGQVTNGGSITIQGGIVTQVGGQISGYPVHLIGPYGGGIYGTGKGSGDFVTEDGSALSGTVAAGQRIFVTAAAARPASLSLSGDVINEGTLGLVCPSGVTAELFTESPGTRLVNRGELATSGPGNCAIVQLTIENAGRMNMDANTTGFDNNSDLTNNAADAVVLIPHGSHVIFQGEPSSSLTNKSGKSRIKASSTYKRAPSPRAMVPLPASPCFCTAWR